MREFRSGHYVNQGHYKSFQPTEINRNWLVEGMEVLQLLSISDGSTCRSGMHSEHINIDLFVQMHTAKEAMQSSKIEGTQAGTKKTIQGYHDG